MRRRRAKELAFRDEKLRKKIKLVAEAVEAQRNRSEIFVEKAEMELFSVNTDSSE